MTRRPTLDSLREQASHCRACPLWKDATQTVFGEGPPHARIMLVGEQPGDKEDLAGHPFVGPAGQMLDRALEQAGIDRAKVYVTNAVKHFKFFPRGKFRLHQKPTMPEIKAYAVPGTSVSWLRSNRNWWSRSAQPRPNACSARPRRSTRTAAA
jgi:uracil-DNA glycosylase